MSGDSKMSFWMFDLGKAMSILLRRAPTRLTQGLRSHGCIKFGLLGE